MCVYGVPVFILTCILLQNPKLLSGQCQIPSGLYLLLSTHQAGRGDGQLCEYILRT